MAIHEEQLLIWSKIGATVSSAETYQLIKKVLESFGSEYFWKNFDVYLQGSYRNGTNIYSESDVDIVIELKSSCVYNTSLLSPRQQIEILPTINNIDTYGLDQFKQDVFSHLKSKFGSDAVLGKKAINIKARDNRRSADVIVCINHKIVTVYKPYGIQSLDGILFKDSVGNQIINYPKYHYENCNIKNQATIELFKKTVRIFKNMRGKLIDTKRLDKGDAPSYFLEAMVWNVPDNNFNQSYQSTVVNCINWLSKCGTEQLMCPNKIYPLLDPISLVTWRKEKFVKFLSAAVDFWNSD